jgi:hypothetical protein
MLNKTNQEATWHIWAFVLSTYPILTGVLGWDPLYQMFKVKTCGTSKRNACGTFPYQIMSAIGYKAHPKSHLEHSAETTRFDSPAESKS